MSHQEINHHIIVAHRDDALLTFGGQMLDAVDRGECVAVHLVYGNDGYLRPEFLTQLIEGDRYTLDYLKGLAKKCDAQDQLEQILNLTHQTDPHSQLQLGI